MAASSDPATARYHTYPEHFDRTFITSSPALNIHRQSLTFTYFLTISTPMPVFFLSLPEAIRHRIYGSLGQELFTRVKVDEYNCRCYHDSDILRSSKRLTGDILQAHRKGRCDIMYIFSDPAALKCASLSYFWLYAAAIPRVISIVLLKKGKMSIADFDETAEAWRKAFHSLPSDVGEYTETVLFDFSPSCPKHLLPRVAKLLNILSAVLRHRSRGRTTCKITGCGDEMEKMYMESLLVGNVSEEPLETVLALPVENARETYDSPRFRKCYTIVEGNEHDSELALGFA